MYRSRLLPACAAALAASVVAATALAAEPARQFPLREFFRLPDKAYFRISDDGEWLSFMEPVAIDGHPRRLNIFVQPLKGSAPMGQPRRLTTETARDIDEYFWKGSSTLLYTKDFGGDENFHVVAVDAKTGKVTDLTPYSGVRSSIVDPLRDDADHILVADNKRDKTVFDVYKVDVHTGESVRVAQNPGSVDDWVTDHAGHVRCALTSDGLKTRLLYRASDKDEFKPIVTTDFRTTVTPLFFDADNKKLYAISNRGRDKQAVVLIDPAKPDAEEVLFEAADVDVESATWSQAHQRVAYADYEDDRPRHHVFDPQYEAVFKHAGARLPGYELFIQSANRAENKFVVAASNDRTEGARYIYDAQHDSLSKLGDLNPNLPETAMAPVEPIVYTARDGLPIHGYLTLPVGKAPKQLACIVNPHGGPGARDQWEFNPEVQFLANRGYCVLQMNFRGSKGYGRRFWEAGFGQWGLKMQDDVTDGVQWLVQQGIADPKRVGIYGGSYGGYVALAGVAFTPDLYAAAVDFVGISNLFTFMQTFPPYWELRRAQMEVKVGDPVRDKERFAQTSPALHVDRIKTPLLIAQGARDPRVKKAESDQVVQALRARGVKVQYMVKDNEGHGFHNEENLFEFYAAMEAFFGEHLKP